MKRQIGYHVIAGKTKCAVDKQETFTSFINWKSFTIYDNLNCKSKYLKYLMKCTLCNIQCVRKVEQGIFKKAGHAIGMTKKGIF